MTESAANNPQALTEAEAQELMHSLLHKEGSWVDWGQKCHQLQKAGYQPQIIFEQTGFQASQQNLVIVAAQVYDSIVQSGADEDCLAYFRGPRSDVLYEFRILNQSQRAAAATLAREKKLDIDGAHEVARAIKDFARLSNLPEGFTNHAGDAVAYQCWCRAREKKDLQDKARFISQGLKYAHSDGARGAIERLLQDLGNKPKAKAPSLPIYRLEVEEELPRIVPVAGTLPLSRQQLDATTPLIEREPFRVVNNSGMGSFVPIPGWQTVLRAQDPVVIFCQSDLLPNSSEGKPKEVLVLVDRTLREWNVSCYFLVEVDDRLEFQWFDEHPEVPIIAQVILILLPKRIVDENNIIEPWQMDD
jgi:Rubisco Assembly chaperone C-terminal domain/Rubisco accumulation factor 1 alpha helical domain/Rubisco accumulation factor 1 helix turn helix domain